MNSALHAITDWGKQVFQQWDEFWYAPKLPHTLAIIRICTGAMLFYTHLIWAYDLNAFLGPNSWIPADGASEIAGQRWLWSYLWGIESVPLLWALHIAALVVFAMLTFGYYSRIAAGLSCLIAIAYCHRLESMLFGLDQINVLLAMYLAVGPCGAVWSLDRYLAKRKATNTAVLPDVLPTISANVATRLIQLHLCVIYLFGGIAKLKGDLWRDGSAVFFSLSSYEYQPIGVDLSSWVAWPILISLLTHLTVIFEVGYCALIWPKLTRPIWLMLAVGMHLGIMLFLSMPTFGFIMIVANMAFLSPEFVRSFSQRRQSPQHDHAESGT